MNQQIPAFSQPFKDVFLDNHKGIEALKNLVSWEGAETPLKISFALNWLYSTLSDKNEEIPTNTANTLMIIGLFVQQLEEAISRKPE